MADLKPIGSEKLQGMDKIARIMEIARYNETPREEINENQTTSYTRVLADGNTYGIVKEKQGYIIKKGINESSLEYAEPMKNRKYHSSYSQALKKLNLIAGELNRLNENEVGTELFGEQKKILRLPKQPSPAPEAPAPAPEAPAPLPEPPADETPIPQEMGDMGGEEMPMDDMGTDEVPMDDMGTDEMPANDMGDEEVPTFKTIQKLTGKLGQKIRTFSESEEM